MKIKTEPRDGADFGLPGPSGMPRLELATLHEPDHRTSRAAGDAMDSAPPPPPAVSPASAASVKTPKYTGDSNVFIGLLCLIVYRQNQVEYILVQYLISLFSLRAYATY